jgi:hypothetical protein
MSWELPICSECFSDRLGGLIQLLAKWYPNARRDRFSMFQRKLKSPFKIKL